jgi:hypothetical protein
MYFTLSIIIRRYIGAFIDSPNSHNLHVIQAVGAVDHHPQVIE